jgi:hypothetical protein
MKLFMIGKFLIEKRTISCTSPAGLLNGHTLTQLLQSIQFFAQNEKHLSGFTYHFRAPE